MRPTELRRIELLQIDMGRECDLRRMSLRSRPPSGAVTLPVAAVLKTSSETARLRPSTDKTACRCPNYVSPLHVLITEDEADIRLLVELQLRRLGFVVHTAVSGREALDIARSQRLDLAILDVTMPEMDGLELLAQLRAYPPTRDVPVIFLTARAEESQALDALSRGAMAYVTKPFHWKELEGAVRDCL